MSSGLVLSEARLGGRRLLAMVEKSVVDLERVRPISGTASVQMTLRDAGLELVRSGILKKGVELVAWRQVWTFVGFDHGEDRSIVAAFESKRINTLKNDYRRLRMRGTRPQFTKTITGGARPRIPVSIPDATRAAGPRVGSFGIGIGAGDAVKVGGKAATREQKVTLDTVLGAAYEAGASIGVLRALAATMLAESGALNLVASASDRGGPLRMPLTLSPRTNPRDLAAVAAWFVSEAGTGSTQAVAAAVMRRPASRYARHAAAAAAIVTTFARGDIARIAQASALVRKHLAAKLLLGVGAPAGTAGESRWDALVRVWTELGWYVFEGPSGLVVMSGQHAKVAKADLVIRPDDPGVTSASSATDEGFRVGRASFSVVEAVEGSIRPGMIVDLVDYGLASGRYVVAEERRTAASKVVSIDLETPVKVVAQQNQAGASRGATVAGEVPDSVRRAYEKAVAIDKQRIGYSYGGTYDCSSGVSAVLIAGGFMSSPQATPGLGSVGKKGVGQFLTMYNNPSPGKDGHVYLVFTLPGEKPKRWEFHSPAGTPGGWKPGRNTGADSSRYIARHFDGA